MGYGGLRYGTGKYKGLGGGSVNALPNPNYMNSADGRCLRLAVKPSQGQGWAEYTGADWLWPEPLSDAIMVTDDNGHQIYLVYDEATGRPYRIGTKDGPTGSGYERSFADKKSATSDGTEIATSLKMYEQDPGKTIEHVETKLRLRPMDENNRSAAGYDDGGYRTGFKVMAKIFKDRALTEESRTKKIPKTGDITMPKKVEGNQLQVGMDTTTSEFRLVGLNTEYLQKDRKSFEQMSHETYQENMATPVLHISRWLTPTLNLATGVLCTGTYTGMTTGVEGGTESAHQFGGAGHGLSTAVAGLSGDFTALMFVSAATVPCDLLKLGAATISLEVSGAYRLIRFNDGVSNITRTIAWDGTGWAYIAVKRSGNTLVVAYNGTSAAAQALAGVVNLSGTAVLGNAATAIIQDCRVYASVVDDDTLENYYDDLTENDGGRYLPQW